jgi:hypothetical protein
MSQNKRNTPAVEATAGVTKNQGLTPEQIAKSEADKATADKATADKAAADKATADKAAADKATADKAAADKAEADKATADKAAADKVAADLANIEVTHDAELIPSGVFIAESGDSFEFAVSQFTFQGKVYTKEEALSNHADVLEHLISVKSFILKKI